VLELAADHPRRPIRRHRGTLVRRRLREEAAAALLADCRRRGTTPFVACLALFHLLLARSGGRWDAVIGVPLDLRSRPELEPAIGFFVNILPLRLALSPSASTARLVAAAHDAVVAAQRDRELPFEALLERLGAGRGPGARPLFQVTCAEEPPVAARPAGGLALIPQPLHNGSSKFDLSLFLRRDGSRLELAVEVDRDLFDEVTAVRLLERYERLLEAAPRAPSEAPAAALPLLSAAEQRQALAAGNDTAIAADLRPVPQRVAAQVAERPDAVAVTAGDHHLSYGALAAAAGRLADRLGARGVGPETRVAVWMERSPELVVALLAVLFAGAAYVPIDPSWPRRRSERVLAGCGARLVLTAAGGAPGAGGGRAPAAPALAVAPGPPPDGPPAAPAAVDGRNLAYVIYTSGSTGEPKGVEIEHRGLANLVSWHLRRYEVGPGDRASHLAGLGFDASVWELWPYLAAGASVHLAPAEVAARPAALLAWLRDRAVTVAFVPTPVAELMVSETPPAGLALRALLTGGDRLHAPGDHPLAGILVNHYGPTECTVVATCGEVDPAAPRAPPIGNPIDNLRAYLLERTLAAVPPGVPGELHLAGAGLARGYHASPAPTAAAFVPDPFGAPGDRLYRTGDLARRRPDGRLDFLGRRDSQVQVRGFRVEPAEVEAAVLRHPGVAEAAVIGRERADGGGAELVAYLVAKDGASAAGGAAGAPSAEQLRSYLCEHLPAHMIPALFVVLTGLPLTASGKVDRGALPPPETVPALRIRDHTPPRTELERALAEAWQELLAVAPVGVDDDFFALGGHSLQITRLVAEIQRRFGVEIAPRVVFERPTVAGLSVAVAEALVAAAGEAEAAAALSEVEELGA
jgi:amino acid adenylation domain-containing protein